MDTMETTPGVFCPPSPSSSDNGENMETGGQSLTWEIGWKSERFVVRKNEMALMKDGVVRTTSGARSEHSRVSSPSKRLKYDRV